MIGALKTLGVGGGGVELNGALRFLVPLNGKKLDKRGAYLRLGVTTAAQDSRDRGLQQSKGRGRKQSVAFKASEVYLQVDGLGAPTRTVSVGMQLGLQLYRSDLLLRVAGQAITKKGQGTAFRLQSVVGTRWNGAFGVQGLEAIFSTELIRDFNAETSLLFCGSLTMAGDATALPPPTKPVPVLNASAPPRCPEAAAGGDEFIRLVGLARNITKSPCYLFAVVYIPLASWRPLTSPGCTIRAP